MIYIHTFCISVLLAVSFTACSSDGKTPVAARAMKTRTVEVSGDYSMDIPQHMKKTTILNEEASLQYLNVYKEMYVIVIDESKENFRDSFERLGEYDTTLSMVQNYRNVQTQLMAEHCTIMERSRPESMHINGLDAEMLTVEARVNGIDVSHLLTFVEGTDNVYFIMAWTMKSKKERYMKDFRTMAKSFKLLERQNAH